MMAEEKPKRQPPDQVRPHCWKPGKSGNPGGRPKTAYISDLYRKQCAELLPNEVCAAAGLGRGSTWGDLIVKRMLREAAMKGSVAAAREIADRVEGRVAAKIEAKIEAGNDLAERLEQLRAQPTKH